MRGQCGGIRQREQVSEQRKCEFGILQNNNYPYADVLNGILKTDRQKETSLPATSGYSAPRLSPTHIPGCLLTVLKQLMKKIDGLRWLRWPRKGPHVDAILQ